MTETKGAANRDASRANAADADLLRRIAAQDRDALKQLYERYYPALLRFMQRITGDAELAREGVNDVMLVVWRSAARFRGDSKVSTWVMGIAYRQALKLRTRLKTWVTRFKAAEAAQSIERFSRQEALTDGRGDCELLQRAMQQLSARHRAVIELTYFYGHSYAEIAEIAGCPVNTVKTRMFHARAKLREKLLELGHDES